MRAIVVADGDPPSTAAIDATWPGWRDGIELVVAADGGARAARDTGFAIDLIVGDGDSLGDVGLAEFAAAGVSVERSPSDKDESDTELAVLACLARGATSIAIIGAFGGRVEHTLANIWLLALPALEGRHAELLDGRTRITLLRAPGRDGLPATASLSGRAGDTVTLLPLGEHVEGITTEGLRYRLRDEPLRLGPARGLSNVRERSTATVTARRGLLVIVESPTLHE